MLLCVLYWLFPISYPYFIFNEFDRTEQSKFIHIMTEFCFAFVVIHILSLKFGMCLLGLSLTILVVIVHAAERSGLFEGISNFDGLSMDTIENNKRRCSARSVTFYTIQLGANKHFLLSVDG